MPADYRQFLLTVNGGVPNPNCFSYTLPDGCGESLADFLYGVGTERKAGDIEYEQELASELDPLPDGFLAIGHDPGASTLLMATLRKHAGKVYFWDKAWFSEDNKEGTNTFPIAPSFTAFLQSLKPIEEEDE